MLELVKYVMMTDMAKSKSNPRRPSDPIALAKIVGDIATGQTDPHPNPTPEEARGVMSTQGKAGGKRGGAARAKSLTGRQRTKIAKPTLVGAPQLADKLPLTIG